jgi:DNA-binding CsgD family transcriptional regulator
VAARLKLRPKTIDSQLRGALDELELSTRRDLLEWLRTTGADVYLAANAA